MSLSKKNLDKLNTFIENSDLTNDHNITTSNNSVQKPKITNNPTKLDDPSKIFYSLIDNSEYLEETSNVNNSLRKSEINQFNMNPKKDNFSKKLTTEEELYDEFNYLLDE